MAEENKTITEIVEKIESLSVLELSELSKALQDKFGVTAAAPVAMAAMPAAGGGEAAAEGRAAHHRRWWDPQGVLSPVRRTGRRAGHPLRGVRLRGAASEVLRDGELLLLPGDRERELRHRPTRGDGVWKAGHWIEHRRVPVRHRG